MKMKTLVSFSVVYSHTWWLQSSLCWGLMTLYQVQNHFQTPGHLCLNCLKTPQNWTDFFFPQKTSTCRLLHISCWQPHLPIIQAKITAPILDTVLSLTLYNQPEENHATSSFCLTVCSPVSISFAHCHLPHIACSPRWASSVSLLDCKHPEQHWACSILNDNR